MALWDDIAYICRYGKQPISEVLLLNRDYRRKMIQALSRMVQREHETTK